MIHHLIIILISYSQNTIPIQYLIQIQSWLQIFIRLAIYVQSYSSSTETVINCTNYLNKQDIEAWERERGPVRVITSHHCVMFSQAQPGRLDPSQPLVMGRNTQEFFIIQRFLKFFFHDEQLIFLKTEDSRVWTLQFVEFQLHNFQLTDIETSVRLQWSCLVLYLELSAGQLAGQQGGWSCLQLLLQPGMFCTHLKCRLCGK